MAVDGLVSGLDTTSIINSLMAIERAPQDAMVARQKVVQTAIAAYASIRTKLDGLSSAAAKLSDPSGWALMTATSSDSSVVEATAESGGSPSSLTFTVDQLAVRHSVSSGNVIGSLDSVAASSGTVSVDFGSGPMAIDVGGGTLGEVVNAINNSDAGVVATAVNTGSGYRLQVSAEGSGATGVFTMSGLDDVGGTTITFQGRDAQLTIGEGAGAYSVTSSTNTFSGVLSGVTIKARAVSSEAVTVSADRDVSGVVDNVKGFVDALNAALTEMHKQTAYDATNKKAAPLAGDYVVRRMVSSLTQSMTGAVTSSSLASVGFAGVQLGRDGLFTFDEDAFTAAFEESPTEVIRLFGKSMDSTGSTSMLAAGPRTVEGSYDVVVTQAAAQATVSGLGVWPPASDATVSIRVGSTEVNHLVAAGTSLGDAVSDLNSAFTSAGLGVEAFESAGALELRSVNYGSGAKFDVAWDSPTWQSYSGLDVAGSIGGVSASGVGRILAVSSGDSAVAGVTVQVDGSGTGLVGTVTYGAGVAQRMATAISKALDSADGYLTGAEEGRQSRVDQLARSISDYDIRLDQREQRLKAYWSQLEVSLGNLQQQSSWLTSQLGSLSV